MTTHELRGSSFRPGHSSISDTSFNHPIAPKIKTKRANLKNKKSKETIKWDPNYPFDVDTRFGTSKTALEVAQARSILVISDSADDEKAHGGGIKDVAQALRAIRPKA